MRNNQIDAHKYTIYTQLGKAPNEYPNGNSMPSVQVALKLMAKGKHVKAKDVMNFVICGSSGGSAENAAKNAHPLDEVLAKDSGLVPDGEYYLHKQILPPVERLCAPISGTNVTLLAECLGLDTSKYKVSTSSAAAEQSNEINTLESQIPDHIRFKDCQPLSLLCLGCKHHFEYRGINPNTSPPNDGEAPPTPSATLSPTGLLCPRPSCAKPMSTLTLTAQLESQIRAHTSRYYSAWLLCDDPACATRTRQMSVYGHRCLGPRGLAHGCPGRMKLEVPAKDLYTQLLYLQNLFDVEKGLEKSPPPTAVLVGGVSGVKGEDTDAEGNAKRAILAAANRERFAVCADLVAAYLDRSGWGWVSMDSLFGYAMKTAGG